MNNPSRGIWQILYDKSLEYVFRYVGDLLAFKHLLPRRHLGANHTIGDGIEQMFPAELEQ